MALYEKVLRVQTKAITLCKAGVRASDIFSFAEKELGKEFTHGLGHGIGVEIHEGPNLGPLSKEVLKDGMVFTVEPGVYSKKYGIRIEDDVYLVNGKCKVLTKTSKKLIIV
jgi:Xaa-Pro aminopeptidase